MSDLPDYVFSAIVPEELEEIIIAAMYDSGKWGRDMTGFYLKGREDEERTSQ